MTEFASVVEGLHLTCLLFFVKIQFLEQKHKATQIYLCLLFGTDTEIISMVYTALIVNIINTTVRSIVL